MLSTLCPTPKFKRTSPLILGLSLFGLLVVGSVHATDGVIEVNQARAIKGAVTPGDPPGFPVTIGQSGSYRLTGNTDRTVVRLTSQRHNVTTLFLSNEHFRANPFQARYRLLRPEPSLRTAPQSSANGTQHV